MEYEYDEDAGVYRTTHDFGSDRSLSTQLLLLVEAVEGTDPSEIQPLFEAVDPDALDALFAPRQQAHRTEGGVWFTLGEYEVTVSADGDIELD